MKRCILLVSLFFFSFMLVGCNFMPNCGGIISTESSSVEQGEEKSVYDKLNEMVVGINSFNLIVSTTSDVETLTSNYSVTYCEDGYDIVYSYEAFNKLNLIGSQEDYKSVKSGTAKVVDGEIEESTGDEINAIPDKLSLSFDKNYFSNVEETTDSFSAKVINGKAFLGTDKTVENMILTVQYAESAFKEIEITYSTSTSSVNLKYTFEK